MKKDSPNEGELIKLARKGKGLTQKQLSEKTGLAVVTIQQYERNLRQPKLENIKKIAEALDITPAYLMGWDKEESLSNTVSKNIKMYREEFGFSRSFVANFIDSPIDYEEALENGTATPTADELQKISRYFGVPLQDFFKNRKTNLAPKIDYIESLLYENGYMIVELKSISKYLVSRKDTKKSYLVDANTFNNFFNSVNDFIQYNFDKMLSNFEPNEISECITAQTDALNATNEKVSELEKRLDKLE